MIGGGDGAEYGFNSILQIPERILQESLCFAMFLIKQYNLLFLSSRHSKKDLS